MLERNSLKKNIPERYHQYAGIGPYFIPIFGQMYWSRLQKGISLIAQSFGNDKKIRICDIGCGFGVMGALLEQHFVGSEIYGVDVYPNDILKCAKKICMDNRNHFMRGDIQNIPFKSKFFDLIFSFDTLEHINNPEKALHELDRIMSENGTLIISVPVESPILKSIRYIYTGLRRGSDSDPHWHGTIKNVNEFSCTLDDFFEVKDKLYYPFNFSKSYLSYDILFTCKKKNSKLTKGE